MNAAIRSGAIVLLLFAAGRATASHIVGGDISMIHLGSPGHFRLTVNQYWDEVGIAKNGNSTYETSITVYVFSRRTRQRMDQFTLRQRDKQPLSYRNEACALTAGLRTSEVHYTADVQFDASRYTDAEGYYVVWERCCRNAAIDNIVTPNQVGQVFYLEFPAMQQNGRDFTNSAPDFNLPNGEYVCLNRPFTLDFGATDKDGDALSYQLITPWAGYTGPGSGQSSGNGTSYSAYPTVAWANGFSDQVVIPGRSPLSIDAKTGRISVTAGQQGLYVFSVAVIESRNGQPIGRVHRDFQLLVAECSVTVPPPAVVNYLGLPTKTAELCTGSTIQLTVDASPDWAYQWQKEGENISGAISSTLAVREPGRYVVVKSLAKTCSRDTASQTVEVTRRTLAPVTIASFPSLTVCTGTAVALQAQPANGQFQWSVGGPPPVALPSGPSVIVRQPGTYTVTRLEAGNPCPGRDSVRVMLHPLPVVSLTGKPAVLCGTDTTRLSASTTPGGRYAWTRDNAVFSPATAATATVTQTGTYRVLVTDANNCTAVSAPFALIRTPKPTVRFDSLAPVCELNGPAVLLTAGPTGGVFSGPGVSGTSFNPALTGAGRFPILYRYTDANGCAGERSRTMNVQPPIGLQVSPPITLIGGDSARIATAVGVPITAVTWLPAAGLNSATRLQPTTGTRESTTYSVLVKTALGCTATANVRVNVVERLRFPTAFTPNADGQNDTWQIYGAASFEYIEVFLYDRWGSLIYHANNYDQPWDGTVRGERVQPGEYTYRVLTSVASIRYAGRVLVLY